MLVYSITGIVTLERPLLIISLTRVFSQLTYHSLVFLEWENSPYCTIVEGAFLNGVGGYKGKCNW